MDDLAASQQLMDEESRAELTPGIAASLPSTNGVMNQSASSSARKTSKTNALRKSKKTRSTKHAASEVASPALLRRVQLRPEPISDLSAHTESDEGNEASSGWPVSPIRRPGTQTSLVDAAVEVPDSQTVPTSSDNPLLSPMTSSMPVPASITKQRSPRKRSRKTLRHEVDANNVLPGRAINASEDTSVGNMSPPARFGLKHQQVSSTPLMISQNSSSTKIRGRGVNKVVETPSPTKRPQELSSSQIGRVWELTENSIQDDEDAIIDSQSKLLDQRLRRLKKSKPRQTESASSHSEDLPTADDLVTEEVNSESGYENGTGANQDNLFNETDISSPPEATSTLETPGEKKRKRGSAEIAPSLDQLHNDTPIINDEDLLERYNDDTPDAPRDERENHNVTTVKTISLGDKKDSSVPTITDEAISTKTPRKKQAQSKRRSKINNEETPKTTKQLRKSNVNSDVTPKRSGRPKKSTTPALGSTGHRRIRRSIKDPVNSTTSAQRALDTIRELNHPPDMRTSGDFTEDEEELIRRAIRDYQDKKGLDCSDLVDIIQWTNDSKDGGNSRRTADFTAEETHDGQESNEFWDEMKDVNLARNLDAIKRHIRSQYHAFKSGGWTKDEDKELQKLSELHPRQWKIISMIMGDRSMHDVHNRWRDYLQHGEQRKTGNWSYDEEQLLLHAVTIVAQRDEDHRAESGYLPLPEYSLNDINWPQVSVEMGNTRNRIQAVSKWTQMMAREIPPTIQVHIKPREPDAKQAPEPTPRKRGRARLSEKSNTPRTSKQRSHARKDLDPLTPMSRKGSYQSVASTPGVDRMLWGDKFDLMEAIAAPKYADNSSIDWHEIAAAMGWSWSVRTLQAALRELSGKVGHSDENTKRSFQDTVDAILEFLAQEHGEELGDHYDPYQERLSDAEEEFDFHDKEGLAGATLPNTQRKRKLGARNSPLLSRSGSSRKMRKTKAASNPTTPKNFKSEEMITESDGAMSEGE